MKDYISDVASGDHIPGGGSVLALVASLGGALTSMVKNLTLGKDAYEDLADKTKSEVLESAEEIQRIMESLNKMVDEDTKAFSGVIKAFKLPKNTDEEKELRSKLIQDGYKGALEVPLRCAEKCLKLLELQGIFAEHGNLSVITDVAIGTLLAYTGLEGSLYNVKINLGNIRDKEYNKEIRIKTDNLLQEGKILKEKSLKIVNSRLWSEN